MANFNEPSVIMAKKVLTFIWLLFISQSFASEEDKLVELIKSKLTKHGPPVNMADNEVVAYLALYQILGVDEKNGIISLKLWFYIYYRTNESMWCPEDFGNTKKLQFPAHTFWVPDVVPLDLIELEYASYDYQFLTYKGYVGAWSSMVTMKFSCSFDVTHFPHDEHSCPLVFGQWIFDSSIYNVSIDKDRMPGNQLRLGAFKDHEQWILRRPATISFQQRFNKSEIVLNLGIKRNPKFYSFLFMYPTFLLYFITPLVFLLPVESGEKSSMAITLLLAQMVSMNTITDVVPASSLKFPIISHFLWASLLQMALNTILAVLVIIVHGVGNHRQLPAKMRHILCCDYIRLLLLKPRPQPIAPKIVIQPKIHNPEVQKTGSKNLECSDQNNRTMSGKSRFGIENDPKLDHKWKANCEDWKALASFLDRVFFSFNVVAVMATFFYFYMTIDK